MSHILFGILKYLSWLQSRLYSSEFLAVIFQVAAEDVGDDCVERNKLRQLGFVPRILARAAACEDVDAEIVVLEQRRRICKHSTQHILSATTPTHAPTYSVSTHTHTSTILPHLDGLLRVLWSRIGMSSRRFEHTHTQCHTQTYVSCGRGVP